MEPRWLKAVMEVGRNQEECYYFVCHKMIDQRDIPFLSMSERVLGEMEPGFGMWDGPQSVGGPVFLIELGLPSA